MFPGLQAFIAELTTQAIRIITGRILTDDQIKKITSHYLGRHFADLFPTPESERNAKKRINDAKDHIENASRIMAELRIDLDAQSESLNALAAEIEENKKLAEHYGNAASVNKDAFGALRIQMESGLRSELQRQSKEGKRLRQFVSFLFWSVTIIVGAAAGRYFDDILRWLSNLIS